MIVSAYLLPFLPAAFVPFIWIWIVSIYELCSTNRKSKEKKKKKNYVTADNPWKKNVNLLNVYRICLAYFISVELEKLSLRGRYEMRLGSVSGWVRLVDEIVWLSKVFTFSFCSRFFSFFLSFFALLNRDPGSKTPSRSLTEKQKLLPWIQKMATRTGSAHKCREEREREES